VKLEWTAGAKHDLKSIVGYIWADNPKAAQRMSGRFLAMAELLTNQPYSGRPGVLPGTREFVVHPNYRMVYRIRGETVSVMAIVHTSRQWPSAEHEGDG
jgi:addiction module RelE/StbE family toxin